jgi:hypothetical protein
MDGCVVPDIPRGDSVTRSYRHVFTRLAPVTAVLVTAGLTTAALATSSDAAETASPILKLSVPVAQQTVARYDNEPVYLYDLGIYAIAEKAAVELHTQRGASYKDPIKTTLTVGEGAAKKVTTLPDNVTTAPDRLRKFFGYTVTDKNGKIIKKGSLDFCPNSFDARRAVPTGAATSPFPTQCGDHPFALGGAFGIQRGWSVPALGDYSNPPSFKAANGNYELRVLVSKPWRDALGIKQKAPVDARIKLKVKTATDEDDGGIGVGAATTTTHTHSMAGMSGMAGMTATDGKLSPQHAAMAAAAQRALGTANKPHTAAPTSTVRTTAVDDSPKPDLRSLPAYQIQLSRVDANGEPTKKTYLNFGATVWNAGPSPLVVDGFRKTGAKDMDAYQYFYDKAGNEVGSAPAGGLQWDPRVGHEHWHFKAFATYRLLDSTKKITERSGKEAFCLAPTDAVDLNKDNANWRPASTDLSTACGEENAVAIREVLDVGWGGTYGQYLPGQSFDITNLANGIYYIEVMGNPDKKLVESNYKNNQALRKIAINGKVGGKRTIKVYDYQGIKAP